MYAPRADAASSGVCVLGSCDEAPRSAPLSHLTRPAPLSHLTRPAPLSHLYPQTSTFDSLVADVEAAYETVTGEPLQPQ